MSPIFASMIAHRWTDGAKRRVPSPNRPPSFVLQWKLRGVKLKLKRLHIATQEHARIYSALAAREAEGSDREFVLLRLAKAATHRAERLEGILRKYGISPCFPAETRLNRSIRWFLIRWRISWTLALLDRLEVRRASAAHEAFRQLSRLCRVIFAAQSQSGHLSAGHFFRK